jgi:hypothetical protein
VGAYKSVSAVSAEIVGGTLPEKRFAKRFLCHNVLICTPESAGKTARAAAGRTDGPAW